MIVHYKTCTSYLLVVFPCTSFFLLVFFYISVETVFHYEIEKSVNSVLLAIYSLRPMV